MWVIWCCLCLGDWCIVMLGKLLSCEEFMVLGELVKVCCQLVVNMFGGMKLVFGMLSKLLMVKLFVLNVKLMKFLVSKLVKGGSIVSKVVSLLGMCEVFEGFMVECVDVYNIQDVIEVIGGEVFKEFVVEVMLIFGVVISVVKLVKVGKVVVQDGYNFYKSDGYKQGFCMGDFYVVVEVIQVIIKCDLVQYLVKLVQ